MISPYSVTMVIRGDLLRLSLVRYVGSHFTPSQGIGKREWAFDDPGTCATDLRKRFVKRSADVRPDEELRKVFFGSDSPPALDVISMVQIDWKRDRAWLHPQTIGAIVVLLSSATSASGHYQPSDLEADARDVSPYDLPSLDARSDPVSGLPTLFEISTRELVDELNMRLREYDDSNVPRQVSGSNPRPQPIQYGPRRPRPRPRPRPNPQGGRSQSRGARTARAANYERDELGGYVHMFSIDYSLSFCVMCTGHLSEWKAFLREGYFNKEGVLISGMLLVGTRTKDSATAGAQACAYALSEIEAFDQNQG
ncbi:hypothetical protein FA13DRAFT_1712726 [Coprinellus micaceus]|uniref:Uncharacterized protein n=1 Tax=Coprinellus micaceus TaxID=71717 RepID=A0A4Y7T0V0_COPMI|nr:hypothetical protein FA13DRAFT_1712726 [Coprinellus micaceus]